MDNTTLLDKKRAITAKEKLLLEHKGVFPVTLDGKTFNELIALGSQDRVNSMVNEENFPVETSHQTIELALFQETTDNSRSIQLLLELDQRGYRPARPVELLAYGTQYPKEVRKFGLTMAMGHLWPYEGYQTCLSYWLNGDECVLVPSYCGAEGVSSHERYSSIVHLAAPTDAPEYLRKQTLGMGWIEFNDAAYIVRRMNPAYASEIPNFVSYTHGSLIISDDIPRSFHNYVLIHEIECSIIHRNKPGRCLRATKLELMMVPPTMRPTYISLRSAFYQAFLLSDYVEENMAQEITASLDYLKQCG